jgi:hypothetical protein
VRRRRRRGGSVRRRCRRCEVLVLGLDSGGLGMGELTHVPGRRCRLG